MKRIILIMMLYMTLLSCHYPSEREYAHMSQVNYSSQESFDEFLSEVKEYYDLPGIATVIFRCDTLNAPVRSGVTAGAINGSLPHFAGFGQRHLRTLHGFGLASGGGLTEEEKSWRSVDFRGRKVSCYIDSSASCYTKIVLCHTHDFGVAICAYGNGAQAALAGDNVGVELLERCYMETERVRKENAQSIYNKTLEILHFIRRINVRHGFELIIDFLKDMINEHIFKKDGGDSDFNTNYRTYFKSGITSNSNIGGGILCYKQLI